MNKSDIYDFLLDFIPRDAHRTLATVEGGNFHTNVFLSTFI